MRCCDSLSVSVREHLLSRNGEPFPAMLTDVIRYSNTGVTHDSGC